jgi:hypothetical protein
MLILESHHVLGSVSLKKSYLAVNIVNHLAAPFLRIQNVE